MAIKKVQPNKLEPVVIDGKHCILVGKDLLKTPKGYVIEAPSDELFERIKADFADQGEIVIENGSVRQPMVFSAYVLASTKRDFMDNGGDLSGDLPGWLYADPVFSPTAGHPIVSMYQVEQQSSVQQFLQEHGLQLNVWQRYSKDDKDKLISLFQEVVAGFSPSQKSALINMSWPNGGQFVATIMYLLGRCTSREWAQLLFSRSEDICHIIGEQPMGSFLSMPDEMTDEARDHHIKSIIDDYEMNCHIAEGFFRAMQ